jgi:hypothetical protein
MNLRDPRFADAQHRSHFFHREFFKVIESEHLALARGKLANGLFEEPAHFRAQRQVVRIFLVRRGTILRGQFVAVGIVGVRLKASDIQAAQIAQQVMQALERYLKLRRDFRLGRVATEAAFAVENRLLEAARLATQRARTPIHLAKAIENGAAYAEFRVVLELYIFTGIVFAHRVHQAKDSGVDEIF